MVTPPNPCSIFRITPTLHTERTNPITLARVFKQLRAKGNVQVAYIQGSTALNDPRCFQAFKEWVLDGVVWALNIGEIRFKPSQLDCRTQVLKQSNITHMFYECTYMPPGLKTKWRSIIRRNRRKHVQWTVQHGNPAIISRCKNMWFNPSNHKANK